jgi:FAD/FMN-containing dehydrogenase
MAERIDIDRLEVILASVGQHLIVEPVGDDDAADRRDRGPWGRRLLAAAVIVAVASAAVASIAPARRAVSGWLRAGNIEVEVDPDLTVSPQLPAFIDDLEPLATERVEGELGLPMPDVSTSRLGPPDAWWSPPELGVLATWVEGDTSLWIVATADTYPASLDKWLQSPAAAESVPDLGDGGYVVEGAHIFQTPFRTVSADSVVAWTAGDLTFRLDSTMSRDRLVAVARSLVTD